MIGKSQQNAGGLLARFVLPKVVYEIEPGFALAARLDGRARQLRRLAVRQLEPHTVEPYAHRSNISNANDLRVALQSLGQTVGNSGGATGLLIPDGAARVAILDFETLPSSRKEAEALILWKMKENLPAAPEEVRLSCQVLRSGPNHVQVLAVTVKSAVLAEYEQAMEPMNGGMSLILPSTMSLLPLVPVGGGGILLLHVCAAWITAAVVEDDQLRGWRCSEIHAASPDDFAQAAALEAGRVFESARDHMRVEIGRVLLVERPRTTLGLDTAISEVVGREISSLGAPALTARGLSDSERTVFENFGTVMAGLVQNAV
ncbi:MAG: hypothetical protein ACM3NO_02900 [Deltaproteobacteria bacterium]